MGHAGTLDPMATGVLVLGIERATRLLGYLTLTEKAYDATIRLGVSTRTDDAEGEVTAQTSARDVRREDVEAGITALTGEISQVPSAVSAVKVAGERAYRKAHRGEDVELGSAPGGGAQVRGDRHPDGGRGHGRRRGGRVFQRDLRPGAGP